MLGLEDNAISSWWEVLRLAWLPHLRRLHLSGNPIDSIYYPEGPPPPRLPHPEAAAAAAMAAATSAAVRGLRADAALAGDALHRTEQQLQWQGGRQPQEQQQPDQPQQQEQQHHDQPRAGAAAAAFPALEALLLGSCRIASWRDVDELDKFPELRELRLSGNPLVADAKSGGRFEVRQHHGCQCYPMPRRCCRRPERLVVGVLCMHV